MRIDVVTQPSQEPVTLAEMKTWLKIDSTDFDTQLPDMITAAREECENICNRAFVQQTLKLTLARFPHTELLNCRASWPDTGAQREQRRRIIELPRAPLISVSSVKYYDPNNALQTVATSDYLVIRGNMPGQLQPVDAWPTTYLREDAVQVTYVAGYEGSGSPANATDRVPPSIKIAIKLAVERDFNPMSADQRTQLDSAILCKLAKFRVHAL